MTNAFTRGLRRSLIVAGACLALATPAFAHHYEAGALKIGHPWSRATPPGAKVGGGYLSVTNTGKTADRLIAVEDAFAGATEIHEMAMDKGVMKMRQLDKGIAIKPGDTVRLAPGGYHIMFMNLKEPLKQGAMMDATLVFEKAGRVPVKFKVEGMGAKAPGEHDHMQMDNMEHKK